MSLRNDMDTIDTQIKQLQQGFEKSNLCEPKHLIPILQGLSDAIKELDKKTKG